MKTPQARFLVAILLMISLLLGLSIAFASGDADAATRRVWIGASGQAQTLGHVAPQHKYGDLDGQPVTDARYVNISFGNWANIRSQADDVRRWAVALRDTGQIRLVSLDHEPMTDVETDGTSDQYRVAARWMADQLRAVAPNVRIVWTVTWISIRNGINPIHQWYPGRRWVDFVASNVFNRAAIPSTWGMLDARVPGGKVVTTTFDGHAEPQSLESLRDMTRWSNYARKVSTTPAADWTFEPGP